MDTRRQEAIIRAAEIGASRVTGKQELTVRRKRTQNVPYPNSSTASNSSLNSFSVFLNCRWKLFLETESIPIKKTLKTSVGCDGAATVFVVVDVVVFVDTVAVAFVDSAVLDVAVIVVVLTRN